MKRLFSLMIIFFVTLSGIRAKKGTQKKSPPKNTERVAEYWELYLTKIPLSLFSRSENYRFEKYSKARSSRKNNIFEVSVLICTWSRKFSSDKEIRSFSGFLPCPGSSVEEQKPSKLKVVGSIPPLGTIDFRNTPVREFFWVKMYEGIESKSVRPKGG